MLKPDRQAGLAVGLNTLKTEDKNTTRVTQEALISLRQSRELDSAQW